MAKAFRFSLQKVLDLRRNIETQQAIELSAARAKLNLHKNKLHSLNQKKSSFLSSLDGNQINLQNLKIQESYLEQLSGEIKQQKESVARSDLTVKEKTEKLVEVSRDKKIVEKLRERHLENHQKKAKQDAVKFQDEVAQRVKKLI